MKNEEKNNQNIENNTNIEQEQIIDYDYLETHGAFPTELAPDEKDTAPCASDESLNDLLQNYVLCGGEFVINLKECKSKEPMTIREFKNFKKHLNKIAYDENGKKKTHYFADIWQSHKNRQTVRGLKYFPSDETFITDEEDGTIYYNTYYIPNHEKPEKQPDLSILTEHLEYLIPDPKEREFFLDWLAFNVQRPDLRSPVTPMLISTHEGTGRGLLVKLFFKMFGAWNIQKCDLDAFSDNGSKSQFNGYMYNSLMCIIEEAKESDKRCFSLADRIKSTLTDTYQQINIKNKPTFTTQCFTNFLFISNNIDAIVLRDNDRRFNITVCDAPPKSDGYYDSLAKWLDAKENIAAIYHMLKERELDIDAFMSQKVMKNEARERVIQSTTNDFEDAFNQVIESKCFKWATIQQVFDAIKSLLSEEEQAVIQYAEKQKQLTKLLQKKPGVINPGKKIKINGKAERLWCFDLKFASWIGTEEGREKVRNCIANNSVMPTRAWDEPIYSDDGRMFEEESSNSYQPGYTQEELQKNVEDIRKRMGG